MKKVYASICLLLAASALQAQVTFGPKIGLNVNYESLKFSGDFAGTEVKSHTPKVGYQAGVAINFKTSENFSIRPEVLFNVMGGETKFGDNDGNENTIKTSYNYLSIPLNFVGTFDAGPGKFNIFVAPQFSLGLNGSYTQTADSTGGFFNVGIHTERSGSLQPGETPSNHSGSSRYFNQINWGINYGIGYQIKGLLFTGQYYMGLTNTQPHYADANAESHRGDIVSKNYGFTVGVTYFFGDTDDE